MSILDYWFPKAMLPYPNESKGSYIPPTNILPPAPLCKPAVLRASHKKEFEPNYDLNILEWKIEGKIYFQVIKLWLTFDEGAILSTYMASDPMPAEEIPRYFREHGNDFTNQPSKKTTSQEPEWII